MSQMPMPPGMPPGMPPMPPEMMMPPPAQGENGAHACPMCGRPMVMPDSSAGAPNVPIPPEQQGLPEGGVPNGQPSGDLGPLLMALLSGGM